MAAKKTPAVKSVKPAPTTGVKQTASLKKRASATRSSRSKPSTGEAEVTIDRRRKSRRGEAAAPVAASPVRLERREKVQRRRQIDPTTCERDYSNQEVEFMNALDQYKRTSGRMFPTCSEVLEVIRSLGYVQLSSGELTLLGRDEQPTTESADLESFDASEADEFAACDLED